MPELPVEPTSTEEVNQPAHIGTYALPGLYRISGGSSAMYGSVRYRSA